MATKIESSNSPFFEEQRQKLKDFAQELKAIGSEEPIPSETFLDFIKYLLDEGIKKKYDIVAVITGREGVGKSTFAWWLGFIFHLFMAKEYKRYKHPFSLSKNVAYSTTEFNEKIKKLQKQCLWMDEGTKGFYKRDSQASSTKASVRLLTQSRQQYNFTLICSPRFSDLDEYLRSWRMRIWIEVTDRGEATVYFPLEQETEDPWNLKDIKKRNKRHSIMGGKGNRTWKIYCPDIPNSIKEEYKIIKRENFLATETETADLSAPERYGLLIGRFLHSLTWNDLKLYIEKLEPKIKKPFTYEQMENICNSVSERYEIEGMSDTTIRNTIEPKKDVLKILGKKEDNVEDNNGEDVEPTAPIITHKTE